MVGDSLVEMVRGFLNKTLLVLIPMVQGPEFVAEFCPISLCTVPFKVWTKVLVNLLKPIMPKVIAENQMSFVGGRHIMDNVVIAQEDIHSMRVKKGKVGWMAIKIDMEKTYDRLRWGFILETLEDANIPAKVIRLIMNYVSSSTMQVIWNGGVTDAFIPTRGVRQRDPMSPYLFVMTVEKLGHAINKKVSDGSWMPSVLGRGGHLFPTCFSPMTWCYLRLLQRKMLWL